MTQCRVRSAMLNRGDNRNDNAAQNVSGTRVNQDIGETTSRIDVTNLNVNSVNENNINVTNENNVRV